MRRVLKVDQTAQEAGQTTEAGRTTEAVVAILVMTENA
jgi:hypothetical protein